MIGYIVMTFSRYKAYCLDILPTSDTFDILSDLIHTAEGIAADKNTYVLIHTVLDNSFWRHLLPKLGYIKTFGGINYYLTVKIHNPELETNQILNKEHWLLMAGDIL